MSRYPFGWSLPPGVTDRMIDEAAGAFDDDNDDYSRAEEEEGHNDGLDAEREEERAEKPAAPFWTVAIYLVDRAYGGPEEGGWWYDCGERVDTVLDGVDPTILLQVVFVESLARVYAEMAQEKLDATVNIGRRDIGSVLSTGRYYAQVYNGYPPAYWPSERPHYE